MRTTRCGRSLTVVLWLSAGAFLPHVASAQSPQGGMRATGAAQPTLSNACTALMKAPSELVRTPEGVALFRFKRELEGLATIFESRVPLEGKEARRMLVVQRGVDSLLEVFVRSSGADGTLGPIIKVPRGDSAITLQGFLLDGATPVEIPGPGAVGGRRSIALDIRALEPQVAAMASAGARIVKSASSTGYLGITLSGSQMRIVTDTGAFTAHCEYPKIEAVDVGSPARAAGLSAGDTVLAYNGRDVVTQTVNYPQLLVPGKVVRVRVRHEGKQREVPVTVRERSVVADDGPAFDNVRIFMTPSRGSLPLPAERSASFEMFFRDGSSSTGLSFGSLFSTSPQGGSPSARVVFGGPIMSSMFGAHMNTIEAELAESLGLEPGVLVMRVQSGSPASEAGLRAGEMIRAVNGVPVHDLATLQRIVNTVGAREVKLTVWGKGGAGTDRSVRIVTVKSRE